MLGRSHMTGGLLILGGCLRILCRFNNLSVITQLGSRRYPISENKVERPWFKPWTPYSKSLTTPPQLLLVRCDKSDLSKYKVLPRLKFKFFCSLLIQCMYAIEINKKCLLFKNQAKQVLSKVAKKGG